VPSESPSPRCHDRDQISVEQPKLEDQQHEACLTRIQEVEAELNAMKALKKQENDYLRKRCEIAEKNYEQSQMQCNLLQTKALGRDRSVVRSGDASGPGHKDWELQGEIAHLRTIMRFSKNDPTTFPPVDQSQVAKDFKRIARKSRDVLLDYDSPCTWRAEGLTTNVELYGLFRRLFGLNPEPVQGRGAPALFEQLVGISINSFVRCILAAALCEWVFEADLSDLFHEDDRLYKRLRGLLASQSKFGALLFFVLTADERNSRQISKPPDASSLRRLRLK
jgi:hypothetical protein